MILAGAFGLSFVVAVVATPIMAVLSRRWGFLKAPGGRHIHPQPVPTLGGVPMAIAILGTSALLAIPLGTPLGGFFAGGLVIVAVGLIDDIWGLSWKLKLVGQLVAGAVFAGLGGAVSLLTNPFVAFGAGVQLGWLGIPLTVIWVVAVINIVNLIDGLDGLASGITVIVAGAMTMVAMIRQEAAVAVIALAVVGAAGAFLIYNFWPAKIFMGDVGSGLLGFALAAVAVIGSVKDTTALTLAAPLIALALPIFDTGFAIVRRVRLGQPIGQADRDHIHHRLLGRGFGQRRAVISLYLITALFGALAVLVVRFPSKVILGTGLLVIVAIGLMARRWGLFTMPEAHQQAPSEEAPTDRSQELNP
ncbi:MAG: glycosyltransferase family 4 protein [Sulfobacillus sp.]